MKNAAFIILYVFLFASCQKECDDQAQPDYRALYTGTYNIHLNINDVSGIPVSFANPLKEADVTIRIYPDSDSCNKLWINGLYGCAEPVPAVANANGFDITTSSTGVHPSEIGFKNLGGQIDADFDYLTISGSYAGHGALNYVLSDGDFINFLSCSGILKR